MSRRSSSYARGDQQLLLAYRSHRRPGAAAAACLRFSYSEQAHLVAAAVEAGELRRADEPEARQLAPKIVEQLNTIGLESVLAMSAAELASVIVGQLLKTWWQRFWKAAAERIVTALIVRFVDAAESRLKDWLERNR